MESERPTSSQAISPWLLHHPHPRSARLHAVSYTAMLPGVPQEQGPPVLAWARVRRVWATGLLVALLCASLWLGPRKVQFTQAREADEWAPPVLYEDGDPAFAWVGCFTDNGPTLLTEGPQEHGFNTGSCAKECKKFAYMALRDAGKCICGDQYAKEPRSQQVERERCGDPCTDEDTLRPTRYCGSDKHNAVYRLSKDAGMVGTWLFGNERSKCIISQADDGRHLRFSVPLPKGQMANGVLHQVGGWLRAELTSNDGEPVGTIRLRLTDPHDTIVSNFKYPGELEWGKDTLAKKAAAPRHPSAAKAAIREWKVVTSHGLNVRSLPHSSADVLGTRATDTIVRGRVDGKWIKLVDEPGYMMVSNGASTFLKEARVDAWEVVTSHGLNVRDSKDPASGILGIKPSGTVVRGSKDGKWVVLVSEPGFMMISNGDNVFLARVDKDESSAEAQDAGAKPTEPATTTTVATTTSTPEVVGNGEFPSIFCYALMMPSGYEPTLLKAQFEKHVGIFNCDDYTIFSNKALTLGVDQESGEALETYPIGGSLTVAYGGKWNTALNTDVFIRVWKAVIEEGTFRKSDWTVKVDPDAVFFPERLRDVLKIAPMSAIHVLGQRASDCHDCKLPGKGAANNTCAAHIQWLQTQGKTCMDALQATARPPPTDCGCICGASSCSEGRTLSAMYLVNCRFGLHGPIEVLSTDAVTAFIDGLPKCEVLKSHPWGEDKFMDKCMQLLGVRRVLEFNLLSEIACGQQPAPCGSPNVAFHPFKQVDTYFDCWKYADAHGSWQ